MQYLAIYLGAVNLAAFIVYGVDKARARRGQWRISERTLMALAALGGGLGAWLAMRAFHHKTRHRKFALGVPLFMALWAAALAAALAYLR